MQVQIHRSVEPKLRQMMARQQRSGSWLVARMIETAQTEPTLAEKLSLPGVYRDESGNLHQRKQSVKSRTR